MRHRRHLRARLEPVRERERRAIVGFSSAAFIVGRLRRISEQSSGDTPIPSRMRARFSVFLQIVDRR